MLLRLFLGFALLCAGGTVRAQEAIGQGLAGRPNATPLIAPSAWIDLRQTAATHSTPQSTPNWVEAVTLVPLAAKGDAPARTVFRIRVAHPRSDLQLLLLRLFFDDKKDQQPIVIIWDESGSQILRSTALGAGIELPTSDSVILPMLGVSCIDVEVNGDGKNVRGLYLDWMSSRRVAQPLGAEEHEVLPERFAATSPLHSPEQDTETFGTVTATLAQETIRIGPTMAEGAAFRFGIESQPVAALLTFEIASARVDAPPVVYVNGENVGKVSLVLTDLADPAYRGEARRLVDGMRFRYTGWLRAQLLVPARHLRAGTNDVIVLGAPGTPAAAIRATQIQLKYLWEKSDYLLDPK